MSLWWMQPGWTATRCASCGGTIYPEGDPDWGVCWPCMEAETQHRLEQEEYYSTLNGEVQS